MGCSAKPTTSIRVSNDKEWVQNAAVYQVFPLTFRHSDNRRNVPEAHDHGGAYGNIKGITESLDHIANLGVDAIWLSPVFLSGLQDGFGYKPVDHKEIHPVFGDWEDMKELVHEAHERGIKIITDQVYNHTSEDHPWFQASRDKEHDDHKKYKDYYIWAPPLIGGTDDEKDPYKIVKEDGQEIRLYPLQDKEGRPLKNRQGRVLYPPNNWLEVDMTDPTPAWDYDPVRGECYLHTFHRSMPDLNINNPEVRRELLEVSERWLTFGNDVAPEKYTDVDGVDGFRLDAVAVYGCDQIVNKPLEDWRAEVSGKSKDDIKATVDGFLDTSTAENRKKMAEAVRGMGEVDRKHIALYLELKIPEDTPKEQWSDALREALDKEMDKLEEGNMPKAHFETFKRIVRNDPGWFIRDQGIPNNRELKQKRARVTNDEVAGDTMHYSRDTLSGRHSFGHHWDEKRYGHDSALELMDGIMKLANEHGAAVIGEVLCPGDPADIVNKYVGQGRLDVGFTPVFGSDRSKDHEHKHGFNLQQVREAIDWGMQHSPDSNGKGLQWILEGHDMEGISYRWHLERLKGAEKEDGAEVVQERMKLLNRMLACLPGSICIFQGQEIGMLHPKTKEEIFTGNDPLRLVDGAGAGMDYRRAQMVFSNNDKKRCFFCANKEHCPVPAVDQYNDEHSAYRSLRQALSERHKDQVLSVPGKLEFLSDQNGHDGEVLGFVRTNPETGEKRLCVFNFSTREVTVNYPVNDKGEVREMRLNPLDSEVSPLWQHEMREERRAAIG